MIKLNEIKFTNWIFPDDNSLRLEYEVEYKKHIQPIFGDIWKSFEEFEKNVKSSKTKIIDKNFDKKIDNRSRTETYSQIISLSQGYLSWPKYRNEKTVKAIYDGFKNNKPMKMPLVLNQNGEYYVMSGNTRMNIAFQLGINPEVIIVNINELNESVNIKDAIKTVEMAPSVKYWMEPEFSSESRHYPQKEKPNSFYETERYGTVGFDKKKWKSKDVVAYDEKGNIIGVFSISTTDPIGAFKITVREDAQRKGWGMKLLDYAEKHGIDIVSNLENNRFTASGRALLIKWLKNKKLNESYTNIVYRGVSKHTPVDEGMYGKGTYFTTKKEYAKNYGDVFKATVNLENPYFSTLLGIDNIVEDWAIKNFNRVKKKEITYKQYLDEKSQEITNRLKQKGYDGVIISDSEVVVFDPKKSITNIKKLND